MAGVYRNRYNGPSRIDRYFQRRAADWVLVIFLGIPGFTGDAWWSNGHLCDNYGQGVRSPDETPSELLVAILTAR